MLLDFRIHFHSFTLIKGLFSSSSHFSILSSITCILLIFLLEILIPSCDSPSLAFHIMYSLCKLNKQGDNIQLFLSSQFGTSLLFHVRFWLLLFDSHTGFSGDREGDLVCISLCICVSIHVSIFVTMYVCMYVSVYLSDFLSGYLFIYLLSPIVSLSLEHLD